MTTAQAAEQSRLMSARTGGRHSFQTGVSEELIAIPMPLLEQQPRLFQQVSPHQKINQDVSDREVGIRPFGTVVQPPSATSLNWGFMRLGSPISPFNPRF